jgi:pimeloyl-ACP methyl ester carboxylesterase
LTNYLYLHGFTSSPQAKKGLAFEAYFRPKGIAFDRVDLRAPAMDRLRLSAMIETARARVGERAVVVGSSLGGLTAARLAATEPRVEKLVLLAPAFQLARRWRTAMPGFDAWQRTGTRTVTYATGEVVELDYGFVEDVERVDLGFPDVRVPTLIFHGVHDVSVPIEHSREFAASRPNVRLIELDDDHELVRSLPIILPEAEAFLG